MAQWVYDHGRRPGTDLPGTDAIYLPLRSRRSYLPLQRAAAAALPRACSRVLPANPRRVLLPEQLHLLETFAGQIALALERAQLADQAQQRRASSAETERLRNALLASISHDLRTPLAVIAGRVHQPGRSAASGLAGAERAELAQEHLRAGAGR